MILTAHQPVYLPWLGLLHKIALADKFCIFDIAQYQTKDFNNRNKVKTSSGAIWLTVPVESKGHYGKKLKDIKIVNDGWNRKHIKTIQLSYSKAFYFKDYFPELESILTSRFELLADLNQAILMYLLKHFGIKKQICKASDYDFKGQKSDLVLDMCLQLQAKSYIFGAQGINYADVASFKAANIDVYFQNYIHPEYSQLFPPFEPYISAIDLLFNEGPAGKEILFQNNWGGINEGNKA